MGNEEGSGIDLTPSGHEPADVVQLSPSRLLRRLYVAAGFFSLFIGLLGLLIPIFPTSPFLLLAAALFARGSERFYRWLLNNRYCGKQIRSWRNNEGLTIATKSLVTSTIAGPLVFSALVFVPFIPVKITLILIAISISVYIWMQPTKRGAGAEEG